MYKKRKGLLPGRLTTSCVQLEGTVLILLYSYVQYFENVAFSFVLNSVSMQTFYIY